MKNSGIILKILWLGYLFTDSKKQEELSSIKEFDNLLYNWFFFWQISKVSIWYSKSILTKIFCLTWWRYSKSSLDQFSKLYLMKSLNQLTKHQSKRSLDQLSKVSLKTSLDNSRKFFSCNNLLEERIIPFNFL
jgi:hypothetical protein